MPRRALLFLLIPTLILIGGALILSASNQSSAEVSGEEWVQIRVPQGGGSADQTLQISRFDYRRTSNTLIDVVISVKNVTQSPQDGLVWYILAPAGSAEPWREAVYSAPEQSVTLAPGGSEDLEFDPPATIPDGEYDLSVWVHGIRDGERFHSDGAGAESKVFIGEPFTVAVTDVDQSEQIDGSTALEITLESSNHSGESVDVEMLFTVIAAREAGSLSGLPEYVSPTYDTLLDNGERATTTLRGAVRLTPGTYNVVGWLRRRDTDDSLSRVVSPTVIAIE